MVNNGLGTVGTADGNVYDNVEDAKVRAKELAAAAPGSVWVVYMAHWYAWTDETPVNLRWIGGQII